MQNVIVTGGAGFIGSHIVDALIKRGFKVHIIDNLSTGKKENLNHKAKFHKLDIRNPRVFDLFRRIKPTYVFHLAAQMDVKRSLREPSFDAEVNILGSLNILNACIKSKIKKIIFTSTGGAIYGDAKKLPTPETCPEQPISPYGVAKLAIDKYLHQFHHVYGLRYTSLRFANIYGPRQRHDGEAGVIAIFAGKKAKGKMCYINGSGRQTRDFVYVADVVNAAVKAMNSKFDGIVNIATGKETPVNDIHNILSKITGNEKKAVHKPAIIGEQKRSVLDWSKAKRVLKWKPRVGLEKGLKKTVDWHYENNISPLVRGRRKRGSK